MNTTQENTGNLSTVNKIHPGPTDLDNTYESEVKALYIPLCVIGVTGNCLVLIRYVKSRMNSHRSGFWHTVKNTLYKKFS